MARTVEILNGNFGAFLGDVKRADLRDPSFKTDAFQLWTDCGGVIVVRGEDLAEITPEELMDWADVFGAVEFERNAAREDVMLPGYPILRIGNVRTKDNKLVSELARAAPINGDEDMRYNPETQRPVWHTDSPFRKNPPIGSVLHCRAAPPVGGDTLFADTRTGFASLDEETKAMLSGLEAVCSLAHHDIKVNKYSPEYPTLSEEQRKLSPPNRVPVVLTHPDSGEPAIYGLNSSTCALLPPDVGYTQEQLDIWDLTGDDDKSVDLLRDLLPFLTGPEFTIRWRWQPGDIVAWDNRCTMHAATGFDPEQHFREMWRLTLLDKRSSARIAAE